MLLDYQRAFVGEEAEKPFLVYHQVQPDKSLSASQLSRGQFWDRARRAARCLRLQGLEPGAVQMHFFSANTLGDLLYRLAAVMVGTVPATINWQADTSERVLHKVRATGARLVLTDPQAPAKTLALLRSSEPGLSTLDATAELDAVEPLAMADIAADLTPEHTRMIIFTSGTTGNPKGVRLPYRAYACNRSAFESFLGAEDPATPLVCVAVNPLHHTNSTAICDWAMRRPGALLHLVERYTTAYWRLLAAAGTPLSLPSAASPAGTVACAAATDGAVSVEEWARALDAREACGALVVAPLVSRHVDFLHTLAEEERAREGQAGVGEAKQDGGSSGGREGGGGSGGGGGEGIRDSGGLQIPPAALRRALSGIVLLLGSAPVGPTTVQRLQDHAGRLPTVRFGSTETCLQVCAPLGSGVVGEMGASLGIGLEEVPFGSSETRLQVAKGTGSGRGREGGHGRVNLGF
jgi:acyl-CoA synthetase (AMP-forming)/AMP-acid ligase II